MPISKNKKFYYLLHGEYVDFKLAPFDESFIDERRNIKRLAFPIPTHISSKPFKGTTFKVMACQGKDRCHICAAKHVPTDMHPVHILITNLNWEEKIFDMQPSAHSAVCACIQMMLDRGATTEDILNTQFRLKRFPKGEKPYFDCLIIQESEPIEIPEEAEVLNISQDDMLILERLTALLKTGKYSKPRNSVIKTLREKYKWSEDKIKLAFETVLDDEGYLK